MDPAVSVGGGFRADSPRHPSVIAAGNSNTVATRLLRHRTDVPTAQALAIDARAQGCWLAAVTDAVANK
jgi:hypothetical protein